MTSGWHSRPSGRLPWCTLDRNPPANAEDKVQSLVREEFTCRGATKPICHNYWGLSSSACDLQQDKPPQGRASTTKKIIIIIKWINWLFFQKDVGEKLHRVKGPELEARQSGFESYTITPSCDPREGLRSSVSPFGNWRWNFCLRGWLFYSWAHLEPWYILGILWVQVVAILIVKRVIFFGKFPLKKSEENWMSVHTEISWPAPLT